LIIDDIDIRAITPAPLTLLIRHYAIMTPLQILAIIDYFDDDIDFAIIISLLMILR
jgi:hypothetical protein